MAVGAQADVGLRAERIEMIVNRSLATTNLVVVPPGRVPVIEPEASTMYST